jgi:hypothetical protein
LVYLIEKAKNIIRNPIGVKSLEEGLYFLSSCFNNTALETVEERLLE